MLTRPAAATADPRTEAQLISLDSGHASAAMTLDRYGHLFGDELDAVAERLDVARAPLVPPACPDATVTDLDACRAGL